MTQIKRFVSGLIGKVLPRTQASARTCFFQHTNCTNLACPTGGAKGTNYFTCCDIDGYGNYTNCSTQNSAACCGG